MSRDIWSKKEIDYLIDNHQQKTCYEIGKVINRTTRSVQHKYNQLGLEKRKAKIGDIVKDWQIIDIFYIHNGQQNISYAKIKSTTNNKEKTVRLSYLTNNQIANSVIKREDNIQRNTTHNMSKTRVYTIWSGMIARCKHNFHYLNKQIKVCDEWHKFENFFEWAMLNGYSDILSIDRIDNSKNYEPNNCRWADKCKQIINRDNTTKLNITAFGETKHFIEWSKDSRCVVASSTLKNRILSGWKPEESITTPSQRMRKKNLKNWLQDNYPNILNEYNMS